jgi:hypothetical protein
MKNRHTNGEDVARQNGDYDGCDVVLGVDGGTTSTVCVCMPLLPFSDHNLPNPLPVLARAVAGSSNHNSVGGTLLFFIIINLGQLQSFDF